MGKATIIASRGEGRYLIRREYDQARFEAMVHTLEELISQAREREGEMQQQIDAQSAGLDAARQRLEDVQQVLATADSDEQAAAQRDADAAMREVTRIANDLNGLRSALDVVIASRMQHESKLASIRDAGDRRVEELAWCADYTEDASGEVGTIELPGEPALYHVPVTESGDPPDVRLLIRPQDAAPGYNAERDGLLMPREWMTPEQAFWNAAVLPGWQKWMPMYRAGRITAINDDTELCDVEIIDPRQSSADGLDVNQTWAIPNLAVEYMTCGVQAFEVGDDVVVEFPEKKWASARVIGFLHHPQRCLTGRFVWMPEGFSLWPRNADAPKGWGLPLDEDGRPTPGGALPFVLVNRKEHNNYPDLLSGLSHRPVGLGYMPGDDLEDGAHDRIGTREGRAGEVDPQFDRRWQPVLYEQDAGRWYAHWPQPARLTPIQQGILDATNAFRAEASVEPLYPPLRGVYGGPADFMLLQMQTHRAQVHEYEGFDPGYVTFDDRVAYRAGNFRITRAREVLASMATEPGMSPYDTGRAIVERAWNSEIAPLHYAGLVSDEYHGEYGDLPFVGFAHIAAGRGVTAFYEATYQGGDIVPLEPPLDGVQAVQVFYGTDRLLAVHRAYWRGEAGTVSWYAPTSCRYGYIHLDFEVAGAGWEAWCGRRSTLAIKGRTRAVYSANEGPYVRAALGAALRFVGDVLRLVVCCITQDFRVQIWEGPAWERWEQFTLSAELDPVAPLEGAEGAMLVGYPVFSASGGKCVIPVTRRVLHTGPALRQTQVNFEASDGDCMTVGSVIDFYEWVGGVTLSRVHRSRLDTEPIVATTDSGHNEYVEVCQGEFRWLADYDGDVLVYATVEFDGRVEQSADYSFSGDYITLTRPTVTSQSTVVSIKQTLHFPDGTALVTTDCTLEDWRASGHVLCLHTLDILHPARTCVSRQTLGNVGPGDDRPSVALSLEWSGDVIKSRPESTAGSSGPAVPAIWMDGCAWGGGVARMSAWSVTTIGDFAYFAYAHPSGLTYNLPSSPSPSIGAYPAMGWGDRVRDARPADISAFGNLQRGQIHAAAAQSLWAAPRMILQVYDNDQTPARLNMWSYGGEWLLSGYYVTPVRLFETAGFWEPSEDRRLWRATFPLEAVVGRSLGNDIEPVGVV